MVDMTMLPWEFEDSDASINKDTKSWEPVLEYDPDPVNGCQCASCKERRSLQNPLFTFKSLNLDSSLTDEQLAVCSPWIFGYVLTGRRWGERFNMNQSRCLPGVQRS